MATKPAAAKAAAVPPAQDDAPTLPAAIKLTAPYSGFWDDGSYYAYEAGAVITDPAVIAYFVGREGALYTDKVE